jgi:hypothetical protein
MGPLHRPALGDPVEFPVGPPVVCEVAGVSRIDQDFPDRPDGPAFRFAFSPVAIPWSRDPFRIQSLGNGLEPHTTFNIEAEDPLDNGNPLGQTRNQLRAVLLRRGEPLTARKDTFQFSIRRVDLSVAVLGPTDPADGVSGTVVVQEVVTERRATAVPPALLPHGDMASDGDFAEILRLLTGLPLLHGPNDFIRVVAPESFGGVNDLDAGFPEKEAVMTRLVVVDPAEPFYVVGEDVPEAESVLTLGISDQFLKRLPALA